MSKAWDKVNKKKIIPILLIVFVGIGYAILSTELRLNGFLLLNKAKWDVHFENVVLSNKNTVDGTPILSDNSTTLEYTINFHKPGDYYSFTVDVVNKGTMDAMISHIAEAGLTDEQKNLINYTLTYEDGTELMSQDVVKAGKTKKLVVVVQYNFDITNDQLLDSATTLNLNLSIDYIKSTITSPDDEGDNGSGGSGGTGGGTVTPGVKPEQSELVKKIQDSALSDYTVDFTIPSGDSGDSGIYYRSGTQDNDYPIYYYRGTISNNNAKFAGFCWKIVRTTETGGTKLVYNGTPNASGGCTNTTGTATQLSSTSTFNDSIASRSDAGYMYGSQYNYSTSTAYSTTLVGNSFTYSNGMYTLYDTKKGLDEAHHYTCRNTSGTCAQIYYYFAESDYILLSDGKSVNDAIEEMETNTHSSVIKTVVDNWFANTFKTYFTNRGKNYNDYLEDTIWCNDRSSNTLGTSYYTNNGWFENGGTLRNSYYSSAYGRWSNGKPSVDCPRKNDSFTVNETEKGNGALTYPVGLLTSDEVMLAGAANSINRSFYLFTGETWWTMSPALFLTYNKGISVFGLYTGTYFDGEISHNVPNYSYGVRPSISIKSTVAMSTSGNGSSTSPYEFLLD